MDFSRIDLVREKLAIVFRRIEGLKSENQTLRGKVSSLEASLKQAKSNDSSQLRTKYSNLVEERDRLMMERELIRGRVKIMVDRIDSVAQKGG